jgi:hypothetical protein
MGREGVVVAVVLVVLVVLLVLLVLVLLVLLVAMRGRWRGVGIRKEVGTEAVQTGVGTEAAQKGVVAGRSMGWRVRRRELIDWYPR